MSYFERIREGGSNEINFISLVGEHTLPERIFIGLGVVNSYSCCVYEKTNLELQKMASGPHCCTTVYFSLCSKKVFAHRFWHLSLK